MERELAVVVTLRMVRDQPGRRTNDLARPLQKLGLLRRAGPPNYARSWVTARGLALLERSELARGLDVLDALREGEWT